MSEFTYESVSRWSRLHDVILNRASVINQFLGFGYDGLSASPCHVVHKGGRYVVEVCGSPFVEWRLYDLASTEVALAKMDTFNDGLWLLNRTGRLQFT